MDEKLFDLFDIEPSEVKKLSEAQKDKLRRHFTDNLRFRGVSYTENELIFTDESVYKNWLYYAGLEYSEELVEVYKGRSFLAVFRYEVSRIGSIIDRLMDSEPNGDENDESVSEDN